MFLLNQNKELDLCLTELNKNGIIVYPTDTIYGIGGDATNVEVSSRINRIKKRKENQPLIFLMNNIEIDILKALNKILINLLVSNIIIFLKKLLKCFFK